MTALRIRNLNKMFGATQVLHDINIEIEEGEFVVFVGPSGCGKSTLLRIIAGLESPSSGEIMIDDRLVNDVAPAKRGIAMVFQSYALYPHLNVKKNMTLALKQEGQSPSMIEERVNMASEMLDLKKYLNRFPSELSGGQRQRVAIGRALVRQPKLFLLDEPLSNLDAALRANTRLEIAKLHAKLGASMVYVTHDQTEAMTLADKIVILRDGRVEQIGSPMELYNNPVNRFVAGFIGSPAMNCLPAALLNPGDDRTMGIRPEDLQITDQGPFHAEVEHVERLGGDTNLIVKVQDHALTVRLFGQHNVNAGESVYLRMDPSKIFYFTSDGGRAM